MEKIYRISDYDFENALNSHSFTVSGADNSYLYFESDAGVNSSVANNGDIVDVYSLDSNGVMSLKFSGTVSGVNQSRFGMNNLIEDPSGLWVNDPITKTAVSDGVIDAITLSGKLIFDISGEYGVFSSESNGENFVDICSSGSFFRLFILTFNIKKQVQIRIKIFPNMGLKSLIKFK